VSTLRWLGIGVVCVMLAFAIIGGQGGPPVGQVAPPIEVEMVGGGVFDLAAQRGRVVVLDFWATWCPPCQVSLPALQRLHERYRGDDRVVIASVNTNSERNRAGALQGWMTQRKFDFPVLLETDDRALSVAYAVEKLPTMVVIGVDGKVADVQVGLPSADVAGIEAHVEGQIRDALAAGGGRWSERVV
jgi:thiol-disulfide isomerase/thioredoxin